MSAATTFPPPGPCPVWCDNKHDSPGEWESEGPGGESMHRYHGHDIGEIGPKAGVDLAADTEAIRGMAPITSAPFLSLWTAEMVELTAAEARQLAAVLVKAADELDRIGGAE
jgi:hypothetical protein